MGRPAGTSEGSGGMRLDVECYYRRREQEV